MNSPRMPQEHHVKQLLGLSRKLRKNSSFHMQADISEGSGSRVLRFWVMTAKEADNWSRVMVRDRQHIGRGRPRVFAQCDSCGEWVSCGRFNQHYHVHEVAQ